MSHPHEHPHAPHLDGPARPHTPGMPAEPVYFSSPGTEPGDASDPESGGYGIKFWTAAGLLLLLATLMRWWVAPLRERLPDDYRAEMSYSSHVVTHPSPGSGAQEYDCIVRRRDQTLAVGEGHAIIQGDAHWSAPDGRVIFETLNLYGVDRRDRKNLPGYGNDDRTGQYLFPPHTEKKSYVLWDPLYGGPCTATFDHVERFQGLDVFVFHSQADGIDETACHASLPDVPERCRVLTYGNGRLRVEPVSGVVVDHEDGGTSHFVEPQTGRHLENPVNQWTRRFTPETVRTQVAVASVARGRIRNLEIWVPLALAEAGLIALAAGLYGLRRTEP